MLSALWTRGCCTLPSSVLASLTCMTPLTCLKIPLALLLEWLREFSDAFKTYSATNYRDVLELAGRLHDNLKWSASREVDCQRMMAAVDFLPLPSKWTARQMLTFLDSIIVKWKVAPEVN